MSNELIIGLVSLAGTMLGTFGGIWKSNKLTAHRIEELEKRVEKHNTVIERTYKVEESVKSAHKRLDRIQQ